MPTTPTLTTKPGDPGKVECDASEGGVTFTSEPLEQQTETTRGLSWPRNIPIDGEPADVVAVVNDYSSWLAESDIPKLFINAEPGFIVRGRIREFIRTWPHLTETTVNGIQYVQEDSPDEIGTAIAEFARKNRQSIPVKE
jgi:haloalkane dehalogenase